jgi:extracellular elastinolytic metalloproteinase
MLINVYAALVADLGFDADARTNPNGKGGNTVFLHVMMDGLSLQPCNPTFVSARDAIIQADANRFAGANECTIRKAFAAKGLGSKAANFVDDDTVPAKCA